MSARPIIPDRHRLGRHLPTADSRESRMLAAGSLTVTVTSLATRRHVTLRFRASAKSLTGPRSWPTVPFADATHVFIEDFDGDRVATYYPRDGEIRYAARTSPVARWTAQAVIRYLAGDMPRLGEQAELVAADLCGRCGRELTDPESIDRGIGPDCLGILTKSRHAAMWEQPPAAASQPSSAA